MSLQVRNSFSCNSQNIFFDIFRFQLEAMRLQNILCPLSALHRRVGAKLRVNPGLGGGVHGHPAHLRLPPLLLHAPLRC